ncbi:hypothetical protein, partial [Rathayibacter sp. VKM Ac-2630]|uniref:hypothetical protein n=1 Tax=Rathayibacter sp. VKM Ac-2630 TaxID=1938617 RepID=UPI001F2F4287
MRILSALAVREGVSPPRSNSTCPVAASTTRACIEPRRGSAAASATEQVRSAAAASAAVGRADGVGVGVGSGAAVAVA